MMPAEASEGGVDPPTVDPAVRPSLQPLVPAATVVLVRDATGGSEVLMVHRGATGAFAGLWAFPGGRVDESDHRDDGGDPSHQLAARRAAVREAREEVDLVLPEGSLEPLAHWVPEHPGIRRFATWFFVAPAPTGVVAVDGSEILDASWMRPDEVLGARDAGTIELVTPTWMTLHYLARFATAEAILTDVRSRSPFPYVARMGRGTSGQAVLWPGDIGFDDQDVDAPGPRHRLWVSEERWRLESSSGAGLSG